MSFQYMPLYTGDYLRDTRFLTPLKHGIYLLSLIHCWDSKGPMPLDEQEAAGICNCRSADEIEALRYVLGRFFVCNEYGHFNIRMQKEIERSESISGARSEAGKLGYQAKAKQLLSKSKASATTISPSPSPSLTLSPKKTEIQAPEGVSESVWQDFKTLRAKLRAPITATSMAGIVREAERAEVTMDVALRTCCERGWRGFKSEWMAEQSKSAPEPAWRKERADMVAKHFPNIAEKKHGTTINMG
jgi:uncharacterized protein YdaU (DUF1376 family)